MSLNRDILFIGVDGGDRSYSSVKITGLLTNGVVYIGPGGLLTTNSTLTYDGTSLLFGTTTPGGITGLVGALSLTAAGTNQNINLTPSGTGKVVITQTSGTTGDDQELLRLVRVGSGASSARGSWLTFFDGPNNTYTAGINGKRQNAGSDFTGALVFYANGASAQTTFSSLTEVGRFTSTGFSITGVINSYNGVAAVAWGVPAIYGTGRSTAQSAVVASVATYTVGAADGSFLITANVLVTASTTHSFTITCAYTDEGNTPRTLTLSVSQLTGTFITAITNVTGTGPYEGVPLHIRCKAATAITVATAGTFTSVTYNVEANIVQVK